MKKNLLSVPLLLIIVSLFSSSVYSQITVSSLAELLPYLDDDSVNIKLAPGTYSITADDIAAGTYSNPILSFEGNASTYDFNDVKINFETAFYKEDNFDGEDVFEIQIFGNDNTLLNLTMEDIGTTAPDFRATNIVMDGRRNRIEGFHMTSRGSYPYGYGDAFGKGGGSVIGHRKHCAVLVRGFYNHFKGNTVIHRAYGHAVYMQGCSYPLIEDNYIEGEMRSTDDMLAEAGTGSPADDVDFMTVWGYKLPGGYMMSLQEEGIRAYNGGSSWVDGVLIENKGTDNPTILNNTIKNLRAGVTLTHATGTKYVEGVTAIGCERGFAIGAGDIVNCKADAQYGPVFGVDYESNKNIEVDITVLPYTGESYNGSKHLAIIIGSGHNITFKSAVEFPDEALTIQIGGDNRTIGMLSSDEGYEASGMTITNKTGYPVDLSSVSETNGGTSCGTINDNGTGNTMTTSVDCELEVICENSVAMTEAECYDDMSGITNQDCDEGTKNVSHIKDGDWTLYNDYDLSGMNSINLRVASATNGGTIEVYTDATDGSLIASIPVENTTAWQTYTTVSANITPTTGEKDIYLVYRGDDGYLFNVNWFGFSTDIVPDPVIDVDDITVSPETLTLTIGDIDTLNATITPTDATNKEYNWSTSDTNIATVTTEGVITTIDTGSVIITATSVDGNFSDECIITIEKDVETSVMSYNKKSDVTIYPNPVKDILYYDISKIDNASKIAIYSPAGAQLMVKNITTDRGNIDVTPLEDGVYFLKIIHSKNSSFDGSEKFMFYKNRGK